MNLAVANRAVVSAAGSPVNSSLINLILLLSAMPASHMSSMTETWTREHRRGLGTALVTVAIAQPGPVHGIREGVAGKRGSAQFLSAGQCVTGWRFCVDGHVSRKRGDEQLAAGRASVFHLLAGPGQNCLYLASKLPPPLFLEGPFHFSLTSGLPAAKYYVRVVSFSIARLCTFSFLLFFFSLFTLSFERITTFLEHRFISFIQLRSPFATLRYFTLHLHFLHFLVGLQ